MEFYKEHIGNVKFWPQITILEKITKNMFFATFCSKQAKNRQKFQKLILNSFLDLKHPIRCCVFSFLWVFADFLNYMPNKVKNWKIW